MMRLNGSERKVSGAMLVFLAVYIAAFGLLLAPKGAFVGTPSVVASISR